MTPPITPDPAAEAASALRAKTTALIRQAMFADREVKELPFSQRVVAMDEISTAVANDILSPLLADNAALRTRAEAERSNRDQWAAQAHEFAAAADRLAREKDAATADRLAERVKVLTAALTEIANQCPATCEITVAHMMADTANRALTSTEGGSSDV